MSEIRWIEQIGANHEVVRVGCINGLYAFRVVPHGDNRWRAEHRAPGRWMPFVGLPRGPYKSRVVRRWHSPQSAMRFIDGLAVYSPAQVSGPTGGSDGR